MLAAIVCAWRTRFGCLVRNRFEFLNELCFHHCLSRFVTWNPAGQAPQVAAEKCDLLISCLAGFARSTLRFRHIFFQWVRSPYHVLIGKRTSSGI